ncbi:MAG: PAS domain S-box protein, partial [Psychrosphaera sp.]|nr:PAS domain S-box protein [Psychrosphaera sp.]
MNIESSLVTRLVLLIMLIVFTPKALADIIGKTDYDFVDKDLADFFRAKDQAAMDAQQTTSNEEEVVFADDGHRAILHTLKTPMHNNQGKLIGILGIARDITDRKQTEHDLHTATQRYGTLIANVPGITYHCACDEHWTMEFISDEVESITGYPASDFIANQIRTYASIIHPDDMQLVDDAVQEKVAIKRPYSVEYRLLTIDNEIKWVYEKGRGVFDSNGDLYRLDGVIIDITERKQAEMEVGQLRSYLSNIIDSMPSIIIGVDIAGTGTQWNNGAEQAMGLTTNEAVGHPLNEVFPRLSTEMPKVQEAINSRQQQSDKKRSYFKNGVPAYEDVIIYPLIANGVEGAVIRVDDVTEQVRLEEMMIQSEKMLSVGGLAAGMAHEINNPLAGIMQTANVMINRLTNKKVEANKAAAE